MKGTHSHDHEQLINGPFSWSHLINLGKLLQVHKNFLKDAEERPSETHAKSGFSNHMSELELTPFRRGDKAQAERDEVHLFVRGQLVPSFLAIQ